MVNDTKRLSSVHCLRLETVKKNSTVLLYYIIVTMMKVSVVFALFSQTLELNIVSEKFSKLSKLFKMNLGLHFQGSRGAQQ